MASDHLDAENENTEQNELPQIEDLKIQVNITVLYGSTLDIDLSLQNYSRLILFS